MFILNCYTVTQAVYGQQHQPWPWVMGFLLFLSHSKLRQYHTLDYKLVSISVPSNGEILRMRESSRSRYTAVPMKTDLLLLLLSLLWSLVEVHSQPAAPYVSFMGENLPNHSHVDLTLLGNDNSDPGNIVRCHTDLNSCCGPSQGVHRGDWYFPDGGRLQLVSSGVDIYETRSAQQVTLRRRNNAMGPSGIYRCTIPTVPVHDDNDLSVRDTVYVGLYPPSGGI